jgi:hypothetical protein
MAIAPSSAWSCSLALALNVGAIGGKLDSMRGYESEFEKKSRKGNPTSVDWDIVKSPDYKKRFNGITGDSDVDSLLHIKALDMLEHRNNTEFEDMHLIGLETKKVEGTQTHSNTALTVDYNTSLRSAILRAGSGSLVSIHNHPNSKPPSGADLESSYVRGYNIGVIICHNGDIYVYKTGKMRISSDLFDMRLEKFGKAPYNMVEEDAYLFTLQSIERDYGVTWEKR